MLILGLPNDIVQDHFMPKLMEPILVVEQCAIDVIERGDMIFDFMVFKAWCLHLALEKYKTHLDWLFINLTFVMTKDYMEGVNYYSLKK